MIISPFSFQLFFPFLLATTTFFFLLVFFSPSCSWFVIFPTCFMKEGRCSGKGGKENYHFFLSRIQLRLESDNGRAFKGSMFFFALFTLLGSDTTGGRDGYRGYMHGGGIVLG